MTFIFQTSQFEPITLPQVGLVAGSLGLTLGYGMGWYISLAHQYGLAQFIGTLKWAVGTFDGHKYICPGMGSVSYAMPGELLSPSDKVP